jgi:hypothetical protein
MEGRQRASAQECHPNGASARARTARTLAGRLLSGVTRSRRPRESRCSQG